MHGRTGIVHDLRPGQIEDQVTTCPSRSNPPLSNPAHLCRIHVIYGMLRAIGCILDMFVLYHAKDLKLLSDENEDNDAVEDTAAEPMDKVAEHALSKRSIVGIVAALDLDSTEPYRMNIAERGFEEALES